MKSLWTGPSHRAVISAKARGGHGDFDNFVQGAVKINSNNFQLYTYFPNFTKKSPSVTGLVTEWVRCEAANHPQRGYKRANLTQSSSTVSVQLNPLGMKTIAHISVHLAGAHGLDLMLKLMSSRRQD